MTWYRGAKAVPVPWGWGWKGSRQMQKHGIGERKLLLYHVPGGKNRKMLWVQESFWQFDMVQVRKVSACTMGIGNLKLKAKKKYGMAGKKLLLYHVFFFLG